MPQIKTIAFDADDTLWINEPIFTKTRLRYEEILSSYFSIDESLELKLYAVEKRNLALFGYGIKGFMLSMIESAIELTEEKINGADIQRIIDLGKEMLTHPIEILPGIVETIEKLKSDYQLLIITKGDLWDQETKIARSGVADLFDHIEIVSEKTPAAYQAILDRYQIEPSSFLMIGNSLKSDILPVCEIGGNAVHIPFHDTWVHEQMDTHQIGEYSFIELDDIKGLFNCGLFN
ncbi:MAG: putative hydrolase of the HAD superfamily [Roseivirga sp.]|jgi:putative hydrolase of the HAD superfamily